MSLLRMLSTRPGVLAAWPGRAGAAPALRSLLANASPHLASKRFSSDHDDDPRPFSNLPFVVTRTNRHMFTFKFLLYILSGFWLVPVMMWYAMNKERL